VPDLLAMPATGERNCNSALPGRVHRVGRKTIFILPVRKGCPRAPRVPLTLEITVRAVDA
jgi:hypothetical protein